MDARVAPVEQRPFGAAALVLALALATIAGAFAFQWAGYAPCELCLKERLPYYAGIVVAAATLAPAWRGPRHGSTRVAAAAGFAVLLILFLGSAGVGAYHAGVEWGWWPGPSDCTGTPARAATSADFLAQLRTVRVVRCDAVAVRVAGLSLAGWNAVVSVVVAATAGAGLRASLPGRRRVAARPPGR